jgi:hypothetical protein
MADDDLALRAELRRVAAQIRDAKELPARRDALIRAALAAGVKPPDLAKDADLKPSRIYQIRDDRR